MKKWSTKNVIIVNVLVWIIVFTAMIFKDNKWAEGLHSQCNNCSHVIIRREYGGQFMTNPTEICPKCGNQLTHKHCAVRRKNWKYITKEK